MFEITSLFGIVVVLIAVWYFSDTIKSVARGTNTSAQYGVYDATRSVQHAVSERDHKRTKRQEKKEYTLLTLEDINNLLGEQD